MAYLPRTLVARSLYSTAAAGLLALGCNSSEPLTPDGVGGSGGDGGAAATGSTTSKGSSGSGSASSTSGAGGSTPCPAGVTCISTFPFTDEGNTATEGTDLIASYDCAPDTNEGGNEIVYRVTIPSPGFLSVAVYDGDGVDIDVHILNDLDPAAPTGNGCVNRGDLETWADVEPGEVWVVADTWVASGGEQAGAYTLDVGFVPASSGDCAMETGEMPRVGDGGSSLQMPATGPVVKEAHLVTQDEAAPFPSSSTEELAEHYALSQNATGLVMHRAELWAPLEGGDFYGAGIGDPADLPALDEGWYVNMYWTAAARPPKGTRMILRLPDDPTRAVVVAAGYETGPSDLSRIGGTTEETHYYLGTDHDATLELGIAADQTLPLGPRRCAR
jgi:hypothetical protein